MGALVPAPDDQDQVPTYEELYSRQPSNPSTGVRIQTKLIQTLVTYSTSLPYPEKNMPSPDPNMGKTDH